MKELLIIFAILLALLMLISTFGGSITIDRYTEPMQPKGHLPLQHHSKHSYIKTEHPQKSQPASVEKFQEQKIEPFDSTATFAPVP